MIDLLTFAMGLMGLAMGLLLGIVALGFVHPAPPLGFKILFGVEALAMIMTGVALMRQAFDD